MAFVKNDKCVGERCEVSDYFLVKVRKRYMTKKGKIVGCYYNDYWNPYTYRAFHIIFDDGTLATYKAKEVNFI